jgi:hypothetical protein
MDGTWQRRRGRRRSVAAYYYCFLSHYHSLTHSHDRTRSLARSRCFLLSISLASCGIHIRHAATRCRDFACRPRLCLLVSLATTAAALALALALAAVHLTTSLTPVAWIVLIQHTSYDVTAKEKRGKGEGSGRGIPRVFWKQRGVCSCLLDLCLFLSLPLCRVACVRLMLLLGYALVD